MLMSLRGAEKTQTMPRRAFSLRPKTVRMLMSLRGADKTQTMPRRAFSLRPKTVRTLISLRGADKTQTMLGSNIYIIYVSYPDYSYAILII
jgi:hypothetical protein